jgi:hypothetical protein
MGDLERITARRSELDTLAEELARRPQEVPAEREELLVAELILNRPAEQDRTGAEAAPAASPASARGERSCWSWRTTKCPDDRRSSPKSSARDRHEHREPRAHQTRDLQPHDAHCSMRPIAYTARTHLAHTSCTLRRSRSPHPIASPSTSARASRTRWHHRRINSTAPHRSQHSQHHRWPASRWGIATTADREPPDTDHADHGSLSDRRHSPASATIPSSHRHVRPGLRCERDGRTRCRPGQRRHRKSSPGRSRPRTAPETTTCNRHNPHQTIPHTVEEAPHNRRHNTTSPNNRRPKATARRAEEMFPPDPSHTHGPDRTGPATSDERRATSDERRPRPSTARCPDDSPRPIRAPPNDAPTDTHGPTGSRSAATHEANGLQAVCLSGQGMATAGSRPRNRPGKQAHRQNAEQCRRQASRHRPGRSPGAATRPSGPSTGPRTLTRPQPETTSGPTSSTAPTPPQQSRFGPVTNPPDRTRRPGREACGWAVLPRARPVR